MKRMRRSIRSLRGTPAIATLTGRTLSHRQALLLVVGAAVAVAVAIGVSIVPASTHDGNVAPRPTSSSSATASTAPPTSLIGDDEPDAEPTAAGPVIKPEKDGLSSIPTTTDPATYVDGYLRSLLTFDTSRGAGYLDYYRQQHAEWATAHPGELNIDTLDRALALLGYSDAQWTRWALQGRTRSMQVQDLRWDAAADGYTAGHGDWHLIDAVVLTIDHFGGRSETRQRVLRIAIACPGSTLPDTKQLSACTIYNLEVRQ